MKLFVFFALLAVALARHHKPSHQLRDANIGEKIKQCYVAAFEEIYDKYFKDSGCSKKDWEAYHNAEKDFKKKLGDLACEDKDDDLMPEDETEKREEKPSKAYFNKLLDNFRKETNLVLSDTCTNDAIMNIYVKWSRNGKEIHEIFKKHLAPYAKEIAFFHKTVNEGFVAAGKELQQQLFSDSTCNLKDLGKIFHMFLKTIGKIALEKGIDSVANLEEPTEAEMEKINQYVKFWKRRHNVSCDVEAIKASWMTMYENAAQIKKTIKDNIIKHLQDAKIPVPEDELEDSCESSEEERDFFEEKAMRKYDLYHEISKRENVNRMSNLFRM
jgi:hypothetical protein